MFPGIRDQRCRGVMLLCVILPAGCGPPPPDAAAGEANAAVTLASGDRPADMPAATPLVEVHFDTLEGGPPPRVDDARNPFRPGSAGPTAAPDGTALPEGDPTDAPGAANPPATAAEQVAAIRFLGVVETPQSVGQVAVLSDSGVVHYGRLNDVVGGRYRIVALDRTAIVIERVRDGERRTLRPSGDGVVMAATAGEARAAGADELEFAIGQGRVTLIAAGVPLRDVLGEWARAGDTRFVGAEALGAAPVSLHLVGVAEAEALRLLLQPAAGYLASRRAPNLPGASVYDRVRIRAERRPPRPAPPARPAAPEPPGGALAAVPTTLSESDQRERLQRLLPPVASGEAAAGRARVAPRPSDRVVLPPGATPRPGMIAELPPAEPE